MADRGFNRRRLMHQQRLAEKRDLLRIRKFEDPILRTRCKEVDPSDPLDWVGDACRTLKAQKSGVGLAAPQVGFAQRVVLVWPQRSGQILVMVNPVITEKRGEQVLGKEGCLSYPGVVAQVRRYPEVVVRYEDYPTRKPQVREFVDFAARVAQHEDDHLNGICRVAEAWNRPFIKTLQRIGRAPIGSRGHVLEQQMIVEDQRVVEALSGLEITSTPTPENSTVNAGE